MASSVENLTDSVNTKSDGISSPTVINIETMVCVPNVKSRESKSKELVHFVDSEDYEAKYTKTTHENVLQHLRLSYIKKLGSGANGDVILVATAGYCNNFAAKLFKLSASDPKKKERKLETFRRETSILQSFKHDNVIKCASSIIGPSYGMILLDYCSGGDLSSQLQNLTENSMFRFFTQILSAIRHIHSRRIVHRDIKPLNILVKGNKAIVTDFGLSEKLSKENNMVSGYGGTSLFMAPEIHALRKSRSGNYDGLKADSYAMGVTLCCMMLRKYPKKKPDYLTYLKQKVISLGLKYNKIVYSVVKSLLKDNPDHRGDVTDWINTVEERKGTKF